ncbi:TetR/AcrR family transcriptional regulator [Yoonia sp.]|uniref:TetR/AcrR family transcriptional regulator n=1 Tax=Yoonia sp. TaxID=2212373 RepID=UPI002FDAE0A2
MTVHTQLSPRVQRTRDKILSAATKLFLGKGFLETRMDDVADEAKVSKQTLYAHAGTKEALFLAMAEAMIAKAVTAQRAAAPDPQVTDNPKAFLYAHAREQLRTAHDPALMQVRRVAIAEAARFPSFGQAVFDLGPGTSIGRLERAFAMWHHVGRLHAPDPLRAARTFNWLIMGGPTSEVMLTGQSSTLAPGASEAHVRECVRVFWTAYGV